MTGRNDHLAYGAFSGLKFGKSNKFGKLSVQPGMRPVSDFRRTTNPLLTMPFGPPQPWIAKGHEGGASSAFGQKVNQSGYLSLWNAQPRSLPPSWNPLLLQGGNVYRQHPDSPGLSDVVPTSSYGRRVVKVAKLKRRKTSKTSKKTSKTRR